MERDDDLSNCGRVKVDDDKDDDEYLRGWSEMERAWTVDDDRDKETWDMVGRKGRNIPKSQEKKRISLRK